jgi:hypothetical protein
MGLQNAPFVLPNAYTVNFGSMYDDTTAIGPSVLRYGLNQFVEAVDPGTSLDTILGNVPDNPNPNDVIVTVSSQFNMLAPSSLAFKNLAHTGAEPGWLEKASSYVPLVFQDTNVLNSDIVNSALLCALLSSGGNPACVVPTPAAPQVRPEGPHSAVAQAENPGVHVFAVHGRLDVLIPQQSLKLAEKNQVPIQVHAPGLTKVEVQQIRYGRADSKGRKISHRPKGGWAVVPVLYRADGTPYIEVVPRVLGEMTLRISGRFPDGGETEAEGVVTVTVPQATPKKLIVGTDGAPGVNAPWLPVYQKPSTQTYGLSIRAIYGDVPEQIDVDPALASFRVRSERNQPPIISVDKSTGRIKPLRSGAALVETTFGGWTSLTCVTVQDHYNPGAYPLPNCDSLLQPGERPGVPVAR